jgi:hypothetical protein
MLKLKITEGDWKDLDFICIIERLSRGIFSG